LDKEAGIDNLVAINKRAPVTVEDEDLMLEELSDDDEDDPDDDDFEIGDELGMESLTTADTEPSDESKKTVWRALSVWNHYRAHPTHDIAQVAYLCSPNPIITALSQDTNNKDTENILAVERVIEKMTLSRLHKKAQDRDSKLARLIDKLWEEHEAFVQWKGFFNRAHIWLSTEREDTLAHEWHKRYSLPFTEVFGQVDCLLCLEIMGISQAERI
jgi:hypothetical protein